MNHKIPIMLIMGFSVYCSGPAVAHHSAAKYDQSSEVTIAGKVTRFDWANPHVYITVEQSTDAGETVAWEFEAQPPTWMRRQGWTANTLHIGDTVSLKGNPARNEYDKSVLLSTARIGNEILQSGMGAVLQPFSSSAAAADYQTNELDGIWMAASTPAMNTFLNATGLPLTEKGRYAVEHFEDSMNPASQCITPTAPFVMTLPDVRRIQINKNIIRIFGELDNVERTIYMDLASHAGAQPTHHGHSIGHWQGKTLAVDTALFSDHLVGNGYGLPSGSKKHLLERFVLNPDGKSLHYSFELQDPEYLTKTVTGEATWFYRPDIDLVPTACDPALASRFLQE